MAAKGKQRGVIEAFDRTYLVWYDRATQVWFGAEAARLDSGAFVTTGNAWDHTDRDTLIFLLGVLATSGYPSNPPNKGE